MTTIDSTIREERIGPDAWAAALADTEGPQLVVAGPGAGKTEFVVRRLIRLIGDGVDPAGIRVLTFSRHGAADIRSRFEAALDHADLTSEQRQAAGAVDISTFHSLASRLLEAHGPTAHGWDESPTLLTGPEHLALVAEMLRGEYPTGWPPGLRGLLGSPSFAEEVADFILRATEHQITPDALREAAVGRSDWAALPGFIERYREVLRERHRLDYGTLMLTAIETLDHPDVRAGLGVTHVLVDEYQDTTAAQSTFLAALVPAGGNLTVAADPYQSIYSFRGAELANVDEFPHRFARADGSPATRRVLTTSFRVPEEILRSAERLTSGDLPGGAGRVESAGPGGRVDVHAFDQRAHEADWIAGEIHRMHLMEGIAYSRIAVLVRSTRRFLPTLSRSFDRRGIPHERPDVRLVEHPALRVVADIVTIATAAHADAPEVDRAARRLLLSPVVGLAPGAERDAQRWRLTTGASWSEIVRELGFPGLSALLADPEWASGQPAAVGFWTLWDSVAPLHRLALDDPAWRSALASTSQMLERLAERDAEATLTDWLATSGEGDFEAVPLLAWSQPETETVTITTLHQVKGLDFDVVFIADAVDGVLPDLRRNASLLNTHLLPTTRRQPHDATRFRIQEEMRLAYTAMTRASRRVVWTTTRASVDENTDRPSRFIDALTNGAIDTPHPSGTPITPLEAEAHLRRILTDPLAAPATRLAALAALADPSLPHLRPLATLPGLPEPGPDRGLVRPDHAFSPSQGKNYETCPRAYVLERHLHVGGEPSIHMTFGTLIHAVAEQADRAAMARGDAHATAHEALAVLDELFDPTQFGGEPWAAHWLTRGRLAVERLYTLAENDGWRTVFVERDLETELDGIRWRGKADRIDARTDGSGVRVIDYKTTKSDVPKREDAAVDLQLGLYALAAGADPEVAVHGPVEAAELWFPLYPTKAFSTRRFVLENLPVVTERMAAISADVLAERFPATPHGNCDRCPVRTLCDQWPEGAEAFV